MIGARHLALMTIEAAGLCAGILAAAGVGGMPLWLGIALLGGAAALIVVPLVVFWLRPARGHEFPSGAGDGDWFSRLLDGLLWWE